MPVFTLTHVGGLADLVTEELSERLPDAVVVAAEFGRLHIDYGGDPTALLALRTIEHVAVVVTRLEDVRPGAEWLDELESILARTDLSPALAVLRRHRPVPDPPTFRVSAERAGSHEFRSPQVAECAGAGIIAATGWRVDLRGYEVEVRVDIRDTEGLVALRLSETALHKRSRLVHPRVTLNPTVAAAMVRLSQPQRGEVVCDPMVGGGTLLTERYAHSPEVTLLGGDLFSEKLALARTNFEGLGVPARLAQWDARRLPLGDDSVDKFLCNPPWGNLLSDRKLNRQTYPWLLSHLRRCLRPGGLAVLLTSERALVRRFVAQHEDVRLVRTDRLSLGGLHPSIHVLELAR